MLSALTSKLTITAGLGFGIGAIIPVLVIGLQATPSKALPASIDAVRLAPAAYTYRLSGEFNRDNATVSAPLAKLNRDVPLLMMKTQVSEADYARCVAEGACASTVQRNDRPDVPVTGVSFEDAFAYARWLSAKTGQRWRLPTDEEWVFAAGSRAKDDAVEMTTNDFVERWMAKYEEEARRPRWGRMPRPIGSFGANENGLLDLSGNVWEWTVSCYTRNMLDSSNNMTGEATENCGIRILEGAHRVYVPSFLREAKSGGCSVGPAPDNLGFRLVREEGSWLANVTSRLRRPFERIS